MASRHVRITTWALLIGSLAVFVGGAHFAFNRLIDAQNHRQLKELNDLILRRSELAVDYAFIGLGELIEKGSAGCDEDGLSELRRQVYQRSNIKDIRVVGSTDQVVCSAFPETLVFDEEKFTSASGVAARNSQLLLFPLRQKSGVALGVLWIVTTEFKLVGVINTDSVLYDVLPEELRDKGQVALKLSDGSSVSSYPLSEAKVDEDVRSLTVTERSERYPVNSSISVSRTALERWNKEREPEVLGLGFVLGLLFGLLLRNVVNRPSNPITDLDAALERGEFRPFMQPIFSLTTGEIIGCEVLARQVLADGTVVPPYRFIPLAEETGRIRLLTSQIVAEALQQLRPWMRSHKSFKVSFNIGTPHLLSEDFFDELKALVTQAKVSARQLVIEITERQEIHDLDRAARITTRLREHGFRIAIDDAGTGHSGLSHIQKLSVDIVKIDKLFVDAVGKDRAANAVIELLVRLAAELHMTTVAEGIETDAQMETLRGYGVDEGQGYVVSPPLAAEAFLSLLESRSIPRTAQSEAASRLVRAGAA